MGLMDQLILIWVGLLGVGGLGFLYMRTNFLTELMCSIRLMPTIWLVKETGICPKVAPKKIAYGYAFFNNKETGGERAYRIHPYSTGKTREAIIFEDLCFPVTFEYMRKAAELKKYGFQDYTQTEVAIFLEGIYKALPSLKNLKFTDSLDIKFEGEDEPITYTHMVDFLKEEYAKSGGNAWYAMLGVADDFKAAREKQLVDKVDNTVIDLFQNLKTFAAHNASAAVQEDMVMNARIAAKRELEGGSTLMGFVKGHWVEIGIMVFIICIGLAYVTSMGGFGKLFSAPAAKIIATTTTTLIQAPPTTLTL